MRKSGSIHILGEEKKDDVFVFKVFCPQAGLALPFPIDEIAIRGMLIPAENE
jgi:hypothetical protein